MEPIVTRGREKVSHSRPRCVFAKMGHARRSSTSPIDIPAAVTRVLAGREFEVVWLNGLGGLTCRVGEGAQSVHLKWTPVTSGVTLDDEIQRLAWAAPYTVVPHVVDVGGDDLGTWFITTTLPGSNAITARWKADPHAGARGIGRGLRALHDALPVDECPFDWRAATRRGRLEPASFERVSLDDEFVANFGPLTPDDCLRELAVTPSEDLVVCHGDACAPNTLLNDDGDCVGHTDFGELGLADRWSDLAVAAWSTEWNYGPGYTDDVYDGYGVARDDVKIRYYRLLWEFG